MMTREAEIEFGFGDMFKAMLRHWVLILIVGIVFACAGAGFGYFRASGSETQEVDTASFEADMEKYQKNVELGDAAKESTEESLIRMKQEWLDLSDMYQNNPMLQVDASNCEWESLTLHFGAASGYHIGTVQDWLGNADNKALFGSSESELAPYKLDIIHVNDFDGESQLLLIGVEGWDTGAALTYLKDYLQSQARNDHVELTSVTSSHGSGYSAEVARYQGDIAYKLNAMQNYLATVANSSTAFYVSGAPTAQETGVSKKTLLKYGIVGFIAGLILGACFVVIRAIRQGRITSSRQVENIFDLELLADVRKDQKTSLAILDANLDVMVGSDAAVMILDSSGADDFSEKVSAWDEKLDRRLLAGGDIFESSETIESLKDASGIIIGIREDVSRLTDVQRLMLRAGKLDKAVLGFIEM